MPRKAHAHPTKDFFVRMLTRDITLEDCILDLLDNSIDGARRTAAAPEDTYENFWARIHIAKQAFKMEDNCGGISIGDAEEHAFHFGKRPDAPDDGDFSIGLYGIGMKRAFFKLGKKIEIRSSTKDEAFVVRIDVEEWLRQPQDWDFDLEVTEVWDQPGTVIEVTDLNPGVGDEFADPIFDNNLSEMIARDYSFFLQKEFCVELSGRRIEAYPFSLRESDAFQPVRFSYKDESGVDVEVIAGMAGLPPDDTSSPDSESQRVEYSGWFVACNDRIVLAGDKTRATVWGDDFPVWHPQYAGFMGIVNFRSADPRRLPWTTTKREVELQDPTYRRAVGHMKKATRAYIDYTNERKSDLDRAKLLEEKAAARAIHDLGERASLMVPKVSDKPKVAKANVQYMIEKERAKRAAKALGSPGMSYRQVGLKTFEYFYENEVEES